MHIIIEGCDNTGKSSLALELAKRLKMPIINRLKVRDNIHEECVDFLTKSSQGFIVDRFHISELAYGPVKRGGIRFTNEQLLDIEKKCDEAKTINIYCYGHKAEIIKQCELNGETFITGNEIPSVIHNFTVAIAESTLHWHPYTIGDDIDKLADMIETYFKLNEIKINDNY